MGKYGPNIKCPCKKCYACAGKGCELCREGIRCSKMGSEWTEGLRVDTNGSKTVVCKIEMADGTLPPDCSHTPSDVVVEYVNNEVRLTATCSLCGCVLKHAVRGRWCPFTVAALEEMSNV